MVWYTLPFGLFYSSNFVILILDENRERSFGVVFEHRRGSPRRRENLPLCQNGMLDWSVKYLSYSEIILAYFSTFLFKFPREKPLPVSCLKCTFLYVTFVL